MTKVALAVAIVSASLSSCGGEVVVLGGSGAAGGTTSTGDAAAAQGGSGGAGAQSAGGGRAGVPCDAEIHAVALPSLDMVVMYDRSAATTAWGPTMKEEVTDFASQPWREGDRMSLTFHPAAENVCALISYAAPGLPLTTIPTDAGLVTAQLQPLQIFGPSPLTPLLQGALPYAIDEKIASPERVVVAVVFMASPPACDNNPQTWINLVNGAFGFGVRTFVVALPDQDVALLNPIAQAGGTGSAVDLSGAGDENQVDEELTLIRQRAVPCAFPIPQPSPGFIGNLDPSVVYTEGGPTGMPEVLTKVANDAACGDDGPGWYEASPERGMLCPASCTTYKQDTAPLLEVVYGCPGD